MHKPETVRIAGIDDVEKLYWQLLGDYHADNAMGFTPSPRKLLGHVQECCLGENGIAGIIDGLDGPIASVGLEIHTPWYSNDEFLVQAWMFVAPEFRKGKRYWQDLFDFSEWWRADMETRLGRAFILESSVQSLNRLPAKLRLWARRHMQVGGVFWAKRPTVEETPQP